MLTEEVIVAVEAAVVEVVEVAVGLIPVQPLKAD
jgi:hypothetical protein